MNVMFSQKYFTNENKLTTCGLRMSQKQKKEVWMCIKNQQLKTHLSQNRRGFKQRREATTTEDLVSVNLQVSVAYLMCSPLHVLMKSWTWEKRVSKSGMFGMENFTNLEEKM